MRSLARTRILALAGLMSLGRIADAQMLTTPTAVEAGRANATREELQRLAESQPVLAEAVRARLRDGDFRVGDRIVVVVEGDSTFHDTVVVTEGPAIKLLSLPEDSLRGVLRSELPAHLSGWMRKYYKNASVKATPLIRFGVLGEVNRPGYYRLPIDFSVSDAIMSAGGPTQRADMPRTILRRRAKEIVSRAAMRDAMTAGLTLDQLGADAGDELVVGARPERHWMNVVQVLTLITGLALSLQASRGF
jgi:hypothetical protein